MHPHLLRCQEPKRQKGDRAFVKRPAKCGNRGIIAEIVNRSGEQESARNEVNRDEDGEKGSRGKSH